MASGRMVRVNELLRREIGLLCEQFISPMTSALVTITGVSTAPDLRNANVRVSVLGSEEQHDEVMRLMLQNRKLLQKELASRITLKYTPVLHFKNDRSAENADRVLSILDELHIDDEDSE